MQIATKLKDYINKAGIVDFSTLKSLNLTTINSLKSMLSQLVKKGELLRAKGYYISRNFDIFRIAPMIEQGYVSGTSALYHHHIVSEYPFTMFIASSKRRSYSLGNYEIVSFRTTDYRFVDSSTRIALPEKAIYDAFKHHYIMSYPQLAQAVYLGRKAINWDNFMKLISSENSAFLQRTGYVMDIIPAKSKQMKDIVSYCKSRVKSKIYLQGRKKGKYMNDWKIIDNIGKEVLLSWWK